MKAIDLFFFPFHKMIKDEHKKPLLIASLLMTAAQLFLIFRFNREHKEFEEQMESANDLLSTRPWLFPKEVQDRHEAASDLQAHLNDEEVEGYVYIAGYGPFRSQHEADAWFHNKFHDYDDPLCCEFSAVN